MPRIPSAGLARSVRVWRLAVPAACVLLGAALLGAGCTGVANLAVATPAIFLSKESGIHHEVVEFHQFQNTRLVQAPPSKVWATLTDLSKQPLFYPWMDRLECPANEENTLVLGQSLRYELKLVGLAKDGTAVVMELEPEARLGMTLFSRSHGSLLYRLAPENGNTRLSLQLTTMIHDLSMVRPASQVKTSLSEFLGNTLKNVALLSEGRPLDEGPVTAEDHCAAPCEDSPARFDVVKGVTVVDLKPEETWKYFNLAGRHPLLFSKVSRDAPENVRNYLGVLGNGIPYKERLGPFDLKGLAVVTSVEPGRSIGLSLFSDLQAGAEYEFLPAEAGKTLFSALYYMRIPAAYRGKTVDRDEVLREMHALVDREIAAFKLRCEELRARDKAR